MGRNRGQGAKQKSELISIPRYHAPPRNAPVATPPVALPHSLPLKSSRCHSPPLPSGIRLDSPCRTWSQRRPSCGGPGFLYLLFPNTKGHGKTERNSHQANAKPNARRRKKRQNRNGRPATQRPNQLPYPRRTVLTTDPIDAILKGSALTHFPPHNKRFP
jgi:hypothetical protein